MAHSYPAMMAMIRWGKGFAGIGAIAVLAYVLRGYLGPAAAPIEVAFAVGLAAGAGFVLLVLRELVMLIAETMIPAP